MIASFNGEVDNTCTRMSASAGRASAPLRTLEYLTFGSSGSVWHYFTDARSATTGFYSTTGGDLATDFAYGSPG